MGIGLRALNWLAGSDLLDRIRIRKGGRAGPLPGHQERLPHGDRRRPHLQGRPAAGQTGAPDAQQIEGPLRRHPRRRAADVPGGAAAPSPRTRSARRRSSADDERETPPELLAQATELGVNMLGVPEELGGVMHEQSAVTSVADRRGARPRRHGHRLRGARPRRRRHRDRALGQRRAGGDLPARLHRRGRPRRGAGDPRAAAAVRPAEAGDEGARATARTGCSTAPSR